MFPLSELEKRFWFLLAGSALAIGIYFRFLSFWVWPLATDEYFIYRSMSFILDSGIPEFPCGGYYSRGLLYQYVTIPLLAIGISPEASIRLVAILSNLAMLPAAYLLARRIGGIRLAAVIVTILALSTWEIVGLSLVAPLVWEGGITVALLNFLPILMRRTSWRFGHLVAAVIIFSTAVIFLQTDFRTMGPASADHPPIVELSAAVSVAPQGKFSFLGPQLVEAPVLGSILVVLSLILVAGFARLLPAYKSESRAIVTLFMLTACILLNQILLAVMVFLGASLVNWFRLQDVLLPRYRRIFLPLCGMLVIWIAVALGFQTEEIPISGPKALIKGLLPLISFPDLIDSFLYPWLLSIPLMLVVLLFGSGLALANGLFSRNYEYSGIRLLLTIVIVSLTVIGAVTIRYTETRYSFHLYPLLVILSLFGFAHFMIGSTKTERLVKRWAPLVFLCLFFLSSDFALDHMVRIGTYDANFRIGYSSARAQHYYQRFDFKSPADFVNRRAAPSDVVIMTSEVVTQYLSTSNRKMNSFVYLHKTDERYKSQACDFGNLERWTGLPLLSEVGDIEALAETNPGSRLWLVADHYALRSTLPHEYLTTVARYEQVFASPDEKFRVYLRPMRE
jgi:hypothetical protein